MDRISINIKFYDVSRGTLMSKDSKKTTHFLGLATVITCLAMVSLASIQPFQLTVLKAQETFFESSIQMANDTASTWATTTTEPNKFY